MGPGSRTMAVSRSPSWTPTSQSRLGLFKRPGRSGRDGMWPDLSPYLPENGHRPRDFRIRKVLKQPVSRMR